MSVALSASGQVALLGAPVAADGAAYLYAESGSTWPDTASATFTPPAGSPAALGSTVALSGDGQVAMMGDAPFTGGEAINGDAYLYSAPPGPVQASQTITVTSARPGSARVGSTYSPAATATSGLPVAFSIDVSSTPGSCSIGRGTVKFTGTGTCIIDANQAGDAEWAAAAQVQVDISVRTLSPRVSVVSASATLAGHYLAVSLSCKNGPCSGNAELVKHDVVLARAAYSISTGAHTTVRVKLTPAGSALFAHSNGHLLTEELVVTVRSGTGTTRMIAIS
jgi:hypothetical protein